MIKQEENSKMAQWGWGWRRNYWGSYISCDFAGFGGCLVNVVSVFSNAGHQIWICSLEQEFRQQNQVSESWPHLASSWNGANHSRGRDCPLQPQAQLNSGAWLTWVLTVLSSFGGLWHIPVLCVLWPSLDWVPRATCTAIPTSSFYRTCYAPGTV